MATDPKERLSGGQQSAVPTKPIFVADFSTADLDKLIGGGSAKLIVKGETVELRLPDVDAMTEDDLEKLQDAQHELTGLIEELEEALEEAEDDAEVDDEEEEEEDADDDDDDLDDDLDDEDVDDDEEDAPDKES